VTLPIDIPHINLNPGELTGIAVRWLTLGPRYFGTGTPPLETYTDANLSLVTGDSRSAPFTTGGTFFSSRALVGTLTYTTVPEPTSLALVSLAGIYGCARFRRNRKS
jgi:hypothetical protein